MMSWVGFWHRAQARDSAMNPAIPISRHRRRP